MKLLQNLLFSNAVLKQNHCLKKKKKKSHKHKRNHSNSLVFFKLYTKRRELEIYFSVVYQEGLSTYLSVNETGKEGGKATAVLTFYIKGKNKIHLHILSE